MSSDVLSELLKHPTARIAQPAGSYDRPGEFATEQFAMEQLLAVTVVGG